jgi:glycerol kinase
LWHDMTEIERLVPPRDHFEPKMSFQRREALYGGWQEAVARTVIDLHG